MKKLLSFAALCTLALTMTANPAKSQDDKSKRPSPPATVTQTISSGATITIDYSQPSVKGRTIGKDVEPMQGKVWRAGANEATTFEVSKDVTVQGKKLPAGKYAVFMIDNGTNWTVIFNKNASMFGTEYEKNKASDVLHITATAGKPAAFAEKLTYTIDKNGKVSLLWGNKEASFMVK